MLEQFHPALRVFGVIRVSHIPSEKKQLLRGGDAFANSRIL
jgi:hypothetical protein